ncbi:hypothetical protein CC80DRAFT_556247 [Byssothecium circinans]|uniref:Uncharacterized protein n=1 Tax=Byssothecium circinans TaxID=147558 RepID=A0A6A5T9Z6_9PLEO|nr:hypothetical protein CC80DRAFT_556247 [Byssothecium circinans]
MDGFGAYWPVWVEFAVKAHLNSQSNVFTVIATFSLDTDICPQEIPQCTFGPFHSIISKTSTHSVTLSSPIELVLSLFRAYNTIPHNDSSLNDGSPMDLRTILPRLGNHPYPQLEFSKREVLPRPRRTNVVAAFLMRNSTIAMRRDQDAGHAFPMDENAYMTPGHQSRE